MEQAVYETLKASSLDATAQPRIRGVVPDFLARTPGGQTIVLEARHFNSPSGGLAVDAALAQLKSYKHATRADVAALVVTDEVATRLGTQARHLSEGIEVVSLTALDGWLAKLRTSGSVAKGVKSDPSLIAEAKLSTSKPTIFAAMPFAEEYEDTFLVAMAPAADAVGAACVRVDQEEYAGDIVQEIRRQIEASSAVVVDLSEARPNVLFEAGFAHALRKPAVHICRADSSDLPFDVRNWNTIPYHRGRTNRLKGQLERRLAAVLQPHV